MTGTMSSATGDWLQFYQHGNLSDQPPPAAAREWAGDVSPDATAINSGTNISSATSPQSGRVTKPNNRRRSRASRRTPTTLVNTDTTNFRAMVQQFTGGGGGGQTAALPYISVNESANQYLDSYNNNSAANLNFGIGHNSSMAATAVPPPTGGYNVQFRQTQGSGSGQQYYQGSHDQQHQAFIQSLQNYPSTGPTRESSRGVGSTQGRVSSSMETGEENDYMF